MKTLEILVSGAGIAGLAAAHWLAKDGHRVVAVDQANRFDPKGHFIAVKGTGVEVLRAMGIYEALEKHRAPMLGVAIHTSAGRHLRDRPFSQMDETLGGYIMLRRASLHQVLHEQLPSSVELRFGRVIEWIAPHAGGAEVAFSDGSSDRFDLVVGAEGVHSPTRERHFPDVVVEPLRGHYIALLIDDHDHGLDPKRACSYVGGGRNVNFLPLSRRRIGVITYQDDQNPPLPANGDAGAWRDYFLDVYADYSPAVRRVFEGIGGDVEVFADEILMVRASRVVEGRIALVGDAGYCPTFFSGMGAAVALQGAYCLASHLRRFDDPATALAAYERRIVPVARLYQSGAGKMRNAIFSRSSVGEVARALFLAALPDFVHDVAVRRFYRTETRMADLA